MFNLASKKCLLCSSFLAIIIFMQFLAGCSGGAINEKGLWAQKGIMNLSEINLKEDSAVKLDGEWEFYWGKLLEPGDIQLTEQSEMGFINVPGSWNGYFIDKDKLSGDGFATFRLLVKLNDFSNGIYAVKMPNIFSSYKLWINGQLLSSNGMVGRSREEADPEYLPHIVVFKPESENVEIVIQVSNFSHAKGGIRGSIYIGGIEQISKLKSARLTYQIFTFGVLFIMAIYHMIIYINRRKDKSILYFGLLCLSMGIRTMFSGELAPGEWLPVLNWEMGKKIEYLAFYISLPACVSFLQSLYPGEMSRRVCNIISFAVLTFICIALATSARLYTRLNIVYHSTIILSGIYMLYGLIKAIVRRREGAGWVFICGAIFIASVVNDILLNNEVVESLYLSSAGMLFFIIAQSLLLSMKSSRAFYRVEMLAEENSRLARETQELNKDLEGKIDERTYMLKDTIARLNAEVRAHRETEGKLRLYATTDIMTGFVNRITGMTILEEQIKLAKRNERPLAVCFIDVNDLKKVNDNYGHAYGDELITTVCKVIKENIRDSDIACRLGGDEFLIIFPQCTVQQAASVWERVSSGLDRLNESKDKRYDVYVSHGFAEYNGDCNMSAKELVDIADTEMYKRKRELKGLVS